MVPAKRFASRIRSEEIGSEFEGVIGRGNSTINGRVDQKFADFFLGDAVVDGGAEVQEEFFIAIEGTRHCQREKTARMAGKARARPDFTPGVAGDEILKWRIEFIGGLRGAINVSIAENFAADFHSLIVAFAVVHRSAP